MKSLVLLLLLTSFVLCDNYHCPPGYFFAHINFEYKCVGCPVGSECPGNDEVYHCPAGTIAPKPLMPSCISCEYGQITDEKHTKCMTCPSKRTNMERTFCLLPNTPQNATDFGYFDQISFPFYRKDDYMFGYMQCTSPSQLITFNSNYNTIPFLILASNQTGTPDISNHVTMAGGVNATLLLESNLENPPFYFKVINAENIPKDYSVSLLINTWELQIQKQRIKLSSGVNKFEMKSYVQYFFDYPMTRGESFKVAVEFSDLNCGLYTSTSRQVIYPIRYNSDYVFENQQSVKFEFKPAINILGGFTLGAYQHVAGTIVITVN